MIQASGWAIDLYRELFGSDHDPSEKTLSRIERTVTDARAAGYQAGVTAASKVAHRIAYGYQLGGESLHALVAAQVRDAILTPCDHALQPGAKEEP